MKDPKDRSNYFELLSHDFLSDLDDIDFKDLQKFIIAVLGSQKKQEVQVQEVSLSANDDTNKIKISSNKIEDKAINDNLDSEKKRDIKHLSLSNDDTNRCAESSNTIEQKTNIFNLSQAKYCGQYCSLPHADTSTSKPI